MLNQTEIRSLVKHNFLNQIIFRMDYAGVLDTDVDKFLQENKDIFKQQGFSKLQVGNNSVFDVQIQDGDDNGASNVSVYPRDKGKVFHIQSVDGHFIEFSKTSFVVLIRPDENYRKIDSYFEFICNIVNNMKDCYSFPEVTRIGLRKINLLYVKNLDKINEIFKNTAFNIGDFRRDIEGISCKNSNENSLLIKDNYHVNYIRNFQEGELDDIKAYQLVLDIDVFQQRNDMIKNIIDNSSGFYKYLESTNNLLFDVFWGSLQDGFKKKLITKEFDDNDIVGVN